VVRQYGPAEEGVDVFDKVVRGRFGRDDGLDALGREFPEHFGDVREDGFHAVVERPRKTETVGAEDEEEVGKEWCGDAEIRVGRSVRAIGTPGFVQVDAVRDDREWRDKVDVCSCGTDDRIDIPAHPVHGHDAGLGEALDLRGDVANIIFCQGFEIAWPGCGSSAEWWEVWDHLVQQPGLLPQSILHERREVFSRTSVRLRVAEDAGEVAIEGGLERLPKVQVRRRILKRV